MEIGTEISQKIRSAIKAKLMELGAYVDEELPDYIMVMVANKKSQAAMTDDLNLFLGGNTDKFTSWLHGLLMKLQTLSTASKKKEKEDKPKAVKEVEKVADKKSSKSSHRKSTEKAEHSSSSSSSKTDSGPKSKTVQETSATKVKTVSTSETTLKATDPPSKTKSPTSSTKSINPPDKEQDLCVIETVHHPEKDNESHVQDKVTSTKPVSQPGKTKETLPNVSEPEKVEVELQPNDEAVHEDVAVVEEPQSLGPLTPDVPEEPEFTVKAEYDEFSEEFTQEAEKAAKIESNKNLAHKERVTVARENLVSPVVRESSASPVDQDLNPHYDAATTTTTVFARIAPMQPSRTTVDVPRARSLASRLGRPPAQSQVVQPVRREAVSTASLRKVSIETPSSQEQTHSNREPSRRAITTSSVAGVKRRMPGSVLGSVKSRRVIEEVEEEYDPLNPAVGNVASVVKVSERRSSVPRKLQASNSLLMKAVSEATKSVVRRKPSRTATAYIPIEQTAERGSSRSKTLFTRSKRDEIMKTLKREALREPAPSAVRVKVQERPVKMEILTDEETEDMIEAVHTHKPKVIKQEIIEVEEMDEERESSEGGDNYSEYIEDRRAVNVSQKPTRYRLSPDVTDSDDSDLRQSITASRNRPQQMDVVEVVKQTPSESMESEEELVLYIPSPKEAKPKLQQQPEQYSTAQSSQSATRLVHKKEEAGTLAEDTRFIVTLDGVDPEKFEEKETPVEVEEASSVSSNVGSVVPVVHVKPKRQKVETVSINLTASDAENDEEEDSTETSKLPEKCKFWPACSNGNQCAYHHPCTPCRSFPNCKFGDKCLYIHPNCKYDAKCTKADCPFTHASKRTPVQQKVVPQYVPFPAQAAAALLYPVPTSNPSRPQAPSTTPKCKFFPNCTNMNCPFTHQKMCRYGASCSNKALCKFTHPSLPGRGQFKWSSNKTTSKQEHISDRKFDQVANQKVPVPKT